MADEPLDKSLLGLAAAGGIRSTLGSAKVGIMGMAETGTILPRNEYCLRKRRKRRGLMPKAPSNISPEVETIVMGSNS